MRQKVSVKRSYPYLSFCTLGFEIFPPVELEDVFRLACFYFSSQNKNIKKALRCCTVGSR